MAYLTDRERIINLEVKVKEQGIMLSEIFTKHIPQLEELMKLNESYKGRLKKARASLKRLKDLKLR